MANILKKWIKAPKRMRVILALLYGYVGLAISLNHTCCPARKYVPNCHLEWLDHHLSDDGCAELYFESTFNQNVFHSKSESHNQYCPACLYNLTSKPSKFSSEPLLVAAETKAKIQILRYWNFTNQFEWLRSNPLRAPPFSIS